MANKNSYYKAFSEAQIPYLNHVVIGGSMGKAIPRIDSKGVKYLESKILTIVDLKDLDDVFYTDKKHVQMNMLIPVFFYPLNDRMARQIEYIEKNVKPGMIVTVRGFLDTIKVEVIKDAAYAEFVVRPETVIEGVSIQNSGRIVKHIEKLGVCINYLNVNGMITGIETAEARNGKPIVHLAIASPRNIPRNIGLQIGDGNSLGIDIFHGVIFTEEAEYVAKNFKVGDVVTVKGRFIYKFFKREIFNKLDRHFIIDIFAMSLISKSKEVKSKLAKTIAEQMSQEEAPEIKNTGEDILEQLEGLK